VIQIIFRFGRFRFIIVVARRLKITKFKITNIINRKVQIHYSAIQ